MPKAVISYDKDLPEVPDRQAHLKPDCHLIKKTAEEYEIVEGRRPSKMLLVNRLREAVDRWRDDVERRMGCQKRFGGFGFTSIYLEGEDFT